MEVVLAGVLAVFEGGQATTAVEVWAEAGRLAVKWRQTSMDAAGQGGIGGLSGERLDTNLQRNTLGHIGNRENVLRWWLRKLPHQIFISSTDPVGQPMR